MIYPETKDMALNGLNFAIDSGELVYLVGESGAGKTTFFKLLLGYAQPSQGELQVDGKNISELFFKESEKLSHRRKFGPVFQDFKLFFGRSVIENVIIGIRVIRNPTARDIDKASEILNQVGIYHKKNNRVDHLSYGERQRVGIARALIREPKILLADEPTGNLDQKTASAILELLMKLKDEFTTTIITTHATHLLPSSFGRLLELKEGQLIQDIKS